jgi:VanZ family protein
MASGAEVVGAADAGRDERLRAWAAVAAWTLVIGLFSGSAFSAAVTFSYLEYGIGPLVRILGLSPEAAQLVRLLVRKAAHVGEYAVLGFLALRALRLSLPPASAAGLALALSLGVAAADELHQATTPDRTGTPRDVALDLAGAALGVALRSHARRRSRAAAAKRSAAT